LDKYQNPKFRKDLFEKIPPNMKKEYFKACGIKASTSEMNSIKLAIEFKWGPNEKTKKFVNFFQYPKYLIPIKEDSNQKIEPYQMLFDFQAVVVFKTLVILRNPLTRALIQMPTGTGKTRTAIDIVVRLLNGKKESTQILWFANRPELLDQAYETFQHIWKHAGNCKIKIIKFWGDESVPAIPKGKCVFFIGYQKFRPLKEKLNPDYIIIDEAHQFLAKTYEDTIESLIDSKKNTRVIGLTATPGRGINDVQNERLVNKFNG